MQIRFYLVLICWLRKQSISGTMLIRGLRSQVLQSLEITSKLSSMRSNFLLTLIVIRRSSELKQGNMTVVDYAVKFEELSRFFMHYNRV